LFTYLADNIQYFWHLEELPLPIERDEPPKEERAFYLKVLNSTKYPGTGRWNLSAAARKLGIPRKTFTYRLKKLNIIN
jgi:DNA-binding NtrC family response regulator